MNELHSTVLYWGGNYGIAKLHGVLITLTTPPNISDELISFIEYIPEIGKKNIRLLSNARTRLMTPLEIVRADQLLRKLTEGVSNDPFDSCGPRGDCDTQWLRK